MKKFFTSAILLCSISVLAQDGIPGGNYGTSFEMGVKSSVIAVQADGKILQAGTVARLGTGNLDIGLVRYNAVMFIDNTFGTSGKVVTPVGSFEDYVLAIKIQPDGKILVAGQTTIDHVNYYTKPFVVRFNSDGTLDNSFGTGGKLVLSINTNYGSAASIALQPDGKIILAGKATTTKSNVLVIRLNSNGSFDSNFGTGGIVITSPGAFIDAANAVALQADGKIVLAGNSYSASNSEASNFILLRYTAAGALDNTLNGNGIVISSSIANGTAKAVAIHPDGKIILAGSGMNSNNSNSTDMVLARYTTTGSYDNTFGSSGILYAPLVAGQTTDYANSVIVQSDNKIVAGGNTYYGGSTGTNFAIARFTSSGVLDNTFATNGKFTAATSNGDYGTVAFQGNNILGGCISNETSGNSFVVLRLNNSTGAALPLPVTLVSFSVQKAGGEAVQIQWKTSSEINSKYFDVQKSSDGINFQLLGRIAAAGNSSKEIAYSFIDKKAAKTITYYRLKQVDIDEKFVYSPVKFVRFEEQNTNLVKYYPNPTRSFLYIEVTAEMQEQDFALRIFNSAGSIVNQIKGCSTTATVLSVNMNQYAKGTYLMEFKTRNRTSMQQVVVQ